MKSPEAGRCFIAPGRYHLLNPVEPAIDFFFVVMLAREKLPQVGDASGGGVQTALGLRDPGLDAFGIGSDERYDQTNDDLEPVGVLWAMGRLR